VNLLAQEKGNFAKAGHEMVVIPSLNTIPAKLLSNEVGAHDRDHEAVIGT
jgi:hypothetical protein